MRTALAAALLLLAGAPTAQPASLGDCNATRPAADGRDNEVVGTPGRDRIAVGDGDDRVDALDGADCVEGEAGDDRLFGDEDDDHLYGGSGRDRLFGGPDIDHLYGETGEDVLRGGPAIDLLEGGDDGDTLLGGAGDDRLAGEGEGDDLDGAGGGDTLLGGPSDDLLAGDEGDDRLFGGAGLDALFAGAGDDRLDSGPGEFGGGLFGGAGDDQVDGDAGENRVTGGPGRDELRAGEGDDVVHAEAGRADRDAVIDCGDGVDSAFVDSEDPAPIDCEIVAREPAPDSVTLPTAAACVPASFTMVSAPSYAARFAALRETPGRPFERTCLWVDERNEGESFVATIGFAGPGAGTTPSGNCDNSRTDSVFEQGGEVSFVYSETRYLTVSGGERRAGEYAQSGNGAILRGVLRAAEAAGTGAAC